MGSALINTGGQPADAPADCRVAWTLERSEASGSVSCVVAPPAAQLASLDSDQEKQAASEGAHGSDSFALETAPLDTIPAASRSRLRVSIDTSASTDAALTYLRTGRLRL